MKKKTNKFMHGKRRPSRAFLREYQEFCSTRNDPVKPLPKRPGIQQDLFRDQKGESKWK